MAEQKTVKKVLIIGGGLAGLSAANLLSESKVDVEVYEALDRVGGRTYTKDGIDMGGAFIGPEKRRSIYLAKKFGVDIERLDKNGLYVFSVDGKIYKSKIAIPFAALHIMDSIALIIVLIDISVKVKFTNLMEPWNSIYAQEWDKMTVQHYFDSFILMPKVTAELMRSVVEVLLGVEPWEMSLLYFIWYIKSGHGIIDILTGAQEDLFKGGSQQLSEKLAIDIKNRGGKVTLSSPTTALTIIKVSDLQSINDKVELKQNYTTTVSGDYAIVATTPGVRNQIQYNTNKYTGLYMQFAQRMPMGSILKTFMFYNTRWWYDDNKLNGIATIADTTSYVGQTFDVSLQSIPAKRGYCLMGFVLGDKAREWQTLTQSDKIDKLRDEYERIFDSKKARENIDYEEYDWLRVDYIGGTGGIAGPGTTTTFGKCISTPIDNIYFAGTESGTDWSGYMDGAIQSGWTAAKLIMERNNISYVDPEKELPKDKGLIGELESLCVSILKHIIEKLKSEVKHGEKTAEKELETAEQLFTKLVEFGFSEGNQELKEFVSSSLQDFRDFFSFAEKQGIALLSTRHKK